ncbi:MAG: hypothetical protein GY696_05585 [Gammaproteobacteria bacterium]|nr:hypothetical protein [Gammaproteobacteria bacterium]
MNPSPPQRRANAQTVTPQTQVSNLTYMMLDGGMNVPDGLLSWSLLQVVQQLLVSLHFTQQGQDAVDNSVTNLLADITAL